MLHIYESVEEAYFDIKLLLNEMSDNRVINLSARSKEKILGINEVFGYGWEVKDPSDVFDLIRRIDKDPNFRINNLKKKAKTFTAGVRTIPPPDKTYTYATRITSQLSFIILNIEEYRNEPNRQSFLSIWDPQDSAYLGQKEVPCSIGYHFIPRKEKLHMVYFMRSLDIDIWPNDVYLSRHFQEYVADLCNMKAGRIIFMVSCLHAFLGEGEDL